MVNNSTAIINYGLLSSNRIFLEVDGVPAWEMKELENGL